MVGFPELEAWQEWFGKMHGAGERSSPPRRVGDYAAGDERAGRGLGVVGFLVEIHRCADTPSAADAVPFLPGSQAQPAPRFGCKHVPGVFAANP